MNIIWTLVITFSVALPIVPGEAKMFTQMCVAAGGGYVEIWGDPDLPPSAPQSPHIAKCFRVEPEGGVSPKLETAPDTKPENKPNV